MTGAEVHQEAARMLEEAHAEIVKRGWTQGQLRSPSTGAVCLLQALRNVNGTRHGEAVKQECYRILRKNLVVADGVSIDTAIPLYNDDPTTTREDVLTLLKASAQGEREKAQR